MTEIMLYNAKLFLVSCFLFGVINTYLSYVLAYIRLRSS